MDRDELSRWMAGYERAWRSPGTDALGELFSDDAGYLAGPFEEPHVGLPAIAAMWEAERAGPDEAFEMDWEIVAVEGDTGVVRAEVRYGRPHNQLFRDLWIVRLDERGRCVAFEEWWVAP